VSEDFDADRLSSLCAGLARSFWSEYDLWIESFGVGSNLSRSQLTAVLAGTQPINATEHRSLFLAVNERLDFLNSPRIPVIG
jgi:hypothetical protein